MSWQRLDEDLLDAFRAGGPPAARVWEPGGLAVVVGRSNDPAREVRLAACDREGVPVLRRRGGGGAVLLAPGCLVVTLVHRVDQPLAVGRHLRSAVELVGDALRRTAGIQTEIRGTGDLCLGDRKVLGSSAFSGRGAFFYQASLLVEANLDLMERYLRHPSREPTYRRGRGHREFLTTLTGAGYRGTAAALALRLRRDLADFPGRVDPGSVVTTEALKYKT